MVLQELSVLREKLAEALQSASGSRPELIELMQGVDRLQLAVDAGELTEGSALEELSSLGRASEELLGELSASDEGAASQATLTSRDLLRSSLPQSRRDERLLRNQARLVEHALSELAQREQEHVETVQRTLLDYARMHRGEAAEGLRTPAEMQGDFSRRVQRREVSLASRAELERIAAGEGSPSELARGGVTDTGDAGADLDRLLARMDLDTGSSLREQLASGAMTLLHTAVDGEGAVRSMTVRSVSPPPTPEAPRGTADSDASAADADSAEVVSSVVSAEAELRQAQARLEALRERHAEQVEQSEAEREALEAASARVANLEAQAAEARQRYQAEREDARKRAAVDRIVHASRDASRAILRAQIGRLRDLAAGFVGLAREIQTEEARARVLELDGVVTGLQSLGARPDPGTVRALAAQVEVALADAVASDLGGDEASARLRTLHEAAQTTRSDAATAAEAVEAAFALDAEPLEATEPTRDDSASEALDAARAGMMRSLSSFEQSFFDTNTLGERVFAVADLLGKPGPGRSARPARLVASPSTGSIQIEQVDYAGLAAQASRQLEQLSGLSERALDPVVDLYAEGAGLELTGRTQRALEQSGDAGDLSNAVIAKAIHDVLDRSGVSGQAARFARSAGRRGMTRSGREELGVDQRRASAPRAMPLFKRKIGVDRSNRHLSSVVLPAIYQVAGFRDMTRQSGQGPLRKSSFSGADPLSTGWALLKSGGSGGESGLLGVIQKYFSSGEQAAQDVDEEGSGGNTVEQWIKSRAVANSDRATDEDAFQSGALDSTTFVNELKAEGQQVPGDVRDRLRPLFPGIDEVMVHIGTAGQRAADAAGGIAMTVGKHIFGNIDWSTPEGMGLLAHELTHTGHFEESGSVSSKEAEAEDMEARVRAAFGEGDMNLALEGRGAPREEGDVLTATAAGSQPPQAESNFHIPYDSICEQIADGIIEKLIRDVSNFGYD